MYASIDLFAGIGGIRKGFENAFGEDISTYGICKKRIQHMVLKENKNYKI